MRAFAYTVCYLLAGLLCCFALPDIWREAHGFWDTVIVVSTFITVVVLLLGVMLWAIDLGLALGSRLIHFTDTSDRPKR